MTDLEQKLNNYMADHDYQQSYIRTTIGLLKNIQKEENIDLNNLENINKLYDKYTNECEFENPKKARVLKILKLALKSSKSFSEKITSGKIYIDNYYADKPAYILNILVPANIEIIQIILEELMDFWYNKNETVYNLLIYLLNKKTLNYNIGTTWRDFKQIKEICESTEYEELLKELDKYAINPNRT